MRLKVGIKHDTLNPMRNTRNRARDKDIFEHRAGGETFVALGKRYGISADRIRQLYLREAFERSGTKK